MSLGRLWRTAVRVVAAVLGAGILYFLWMAVFLLTHARWGSAWGTVWFLLAPAVTASGFALGHLGGAQVARGPPFTFKRRFLVPLVGCAIGAAAVYG
jgi:hypothetical protein